MTRNLRNQVVDLAEHALRSWFGDDISREDAALALPGWRFVGGLDDELRAEVLSRFPASEPPAVPGLDFLPPLFCDKCGHRNLKHSAGSGCREDYCPCLLAGDEASDAKTIVAESLAEPKTECWCGKALLANGFCPDYVHGPAKVEVTP